MCLCCTSSQNVASRAWDIKAGAHQPAVAALAAALSQVRPRSSWFPGPQHLSYHAACLRQEEGGYTIVGSFGDQFSDLSGLAMSESSWKLPNPVRPFCSHTLLLNVRGCFLTHRGQWQAMSAACMATFNLPAAIGCESGIYQCPCTQVSHCV